MSDEGQEVQQALAEAELGIQVEQFLENSPVGRYLVGCGEQDEQRVLDELIDFDAYKYTTLGELQTAFAKIQQNLLISRKVHNYLTDAIINGRQAEEIIANIED